MPIIAGRFEIGKLKQRGHGWKVFSYIVVLIDLACVGCMSDQFVGGVISTIHEM